MNWPQSWLSVLLSLPVHAGSGRHLNPYGSLMTFAGFPLKLVYITLPVIQPKQGISQTLEVEEQI